MSKNNIGENIRKYRMMAGFTQAELAEKLSEVEGKTIAASAVAGYENGQRTPKVEIRVQMARILGVDPVGLSGIELDEMDEKRLLCKLLSKYASDISLTEDGTVNVIIPHLEAYKSFVIFIQLLVQDFDLGSPCCILLFQEDHLRAFQTEDRRIYPRI